ncbi:cytochrome b561 and DOMON domain-containing protein At5g35735-like [Vitis riparia]|uniref:cytochrome b561 and DOMON domain-containing protein At5g35735-like n=1 Tax=Vitis riparia TaxID=96939 RepID=UPI00155B20A1|nr:cytochrome b561 and DOMON domain-containing protein At5g35735-like [Vitis riparia]
MDALGVDSISAFFSGKSKTIQVYSTKLKAMSMTSHSLIILGLFFSLPSTIALYLTTAREVYELPTPATSQKTDTGLTTDLSWQRRKVWHHRHHLRNVHGILNIIGWGTLLPLGAIIARYFRKFPMECSEWFSLHILCQTLGYLLGSLGWAIGIWLGNSSINYTFHSHRILGIIIFTFSTLQIFSIALQPRRENKCRKYWEICHRLLGYVLMVLIMTNIFVGINHQSPAAKWIWFYVGVLVVMGLVSIALEIVRWIKLVQNQTVLLNSSIYAANS